MLLLSKYSTKVIDISFSMKKLNEAFFIGGQVQTRHFATFDVVSKNISGTHSLFIVIHTCLVLLLKNKIICPQNNPPKQLKTIHSSEDSTDIILELHYTATFKSVDNDHFITGFSHKCFVLATAVHIIITIIII